MNSEDDNIWAFEGDVKIVAKTADYRYQSGVDGHYNEGIHYCIKQGGTAGNYNPVLEGNFKDGIFYLIGGIFMDDLFELYDLKVEVTQGDKPMVCSHNVGDYFLVQGENLIFEKNNSFSMYSLAAIIPLLPAKQRITHPNDWMSTDGYIACPDPNCGARFKITRTAKRVLSHSACTVVPLLNEEE